MIIDSKTEDCRQCTIKHLSTALVALTDEEIPEILKKIYFCGHLSHAANHFVHISEELAEAIRTLRLDAQDEQLNFILSVDVLQNRLTNLINDIAAYTAPEPPKQSAPVKVVTAPQPVQKRGCPCHNR